jgi:hypothetical protein
MLFYNLSLCQKKFHIKNLQLRRKLKLYEILEVFFSFWLCDIAGTVSLPEAVAAWETRFLHLGETNLGKKILQ